MKHQESEELCRRLIELEGNPYGDDEYECRGEISCAEQQQNECEAEARNEVALYGDSWAGSDQDLYQGRQGIAALHREARDIRRALGLD